MNRLDSLHIAAVLVNNKAREHLRFSVRERIKHLSESQFIDLCFFGLGKEHYPLLMELVQVRAERKEMEMTWQPHIKVAKRRHASLLYLEKSHRKTLTVRMTELKPGGYRPELCEWLLINGLWGNV